MMSPDSDIQKTDVDWVNENPYYNLWDFFTNKFSLLQKIEVCYLQNEEGYVTL